MLCNCLQQTTSADVIFQKHFFCALRVNACVISINASADPEGGTGGPDPPPPGKSQDIWVSIGNKQLDPPGKCSTPSGTLKNDRFL